MHVSCRRVARILPKFHVQVLDESAGRLPGSPHAGVMLEDLVEAAREHLDLHRVAKPRIVQSLDELGGARRGALLRVHAHQHHLRAPAGPAVGHEVRGARIERLPRNVPRAPHVAPDIVPAPHVYQQHLAALPTRRQTIHNVVQVGVAEGRPGHTN